MSNSDVTIQFLGHAAFSISVKGFVILIDPWLNNPKAPEGAIDTLTKVDVILISHGHFDHVGDAAMLAKKFKAQVYCIHEVSFYLKGEGVADEQIVGMNIGGTADLGNGCQATMTQAVHSGGCGSEHPLQVGGAAAGWVVHLPNGHRIYHSGDTDVFGDMKVISDLYSPDVALLSIGDHYTMGPRGAAYAINNLLKSVNIVVPMHFGTFPLLAGTPAELKKLVTSKTVNVCELKPGETLDLPGRSVGEALSALH
ncbi:hypothetical protein SARC_07738 [Sphaeroforma arctica JP610]|uniref:Metallo-beta-lactamase domain-containing protein n=1 Tax=Sphaeroforma arctica JP610 TaxID=667725 RepID=A0A0L0FT60_9EUKA|nr:hypothetical protein SARC_07738 [Sphaeroforma arctica JP610]KNC79884.1 hypothetical protein SARC_07738 [Sphaeroforma arctica JP610]|eukprot:XP_014153786.1 hypothetical protein SARC_07738 [Sphaeroforma arctica JP610]